MNEPRIKTWLAERWSAWENDPPPWFDDDFKRSLPACILPEGVHVPKPMSSAAKLRVAIAAGSNKVQSVISSKVGDMLKMKFSSGKSKVGVESTDGAAAWELEREEVRTEMGTMRHPVYSM